MQGKEEETSCAYKIFAKLIGSDCWGDECVWVEIFVLFKQGKAQCKY